MGTLICTFLFTLAVFLNSIGKYNKIYSQYIQQLALSEIETRSNCPFEKVDKILHFFMRYRFSFFL